MLSTIISVTKKPGLYRVITQGKGSIIVESLIDQKRIPVSTNEKAISLRDIAIYTATKEEPLYNVLTTIFEKENGQQASIDPKSSADALRAYFAEILPDFDESRVYPSDIKKIITWYNLLVANQITKFEPTEEPTEEPAE